MASDIELQAFISSIESSVTEALPELTWTQLHRLTKALDRFASKCWDAEVDKRGTDDVTDPLEIEELYLKAKDEEFWEDDDE